MINENKLLKTRLKLLNVDFKQDFFGNRQQLLSRTGLTTGQQVISNEDIFLRKNLRRGKALNLPPPSVDVYVRGNCTS